MTDFDVREALASATAQNDQISAAVGAQAEEAKEIVTEASTGIVKWVVFLLDLGVPPENIAGSLAAMAHQAIDEVQKLR